MKQSCSPEELDQWFEPLRIVPDTHDKAVSIFFPHPFFRTWFSSHVQDRFEQQLSLFLGPGHSIRYQDGVQPGAPHSALLAPGEKKTDYPFGPGCTFENFLTNQKNYFPWASAKDIVSQKEVQFNPFVICGGNGAGKTHIIKAIANELSKIYDKNLIFCGTPEDINTIFKTQYKGDIFKARQYFYKYKFLLIDDLHTITDSQTVQEEFITIFNHFHEHRKQMVFSCPEKLPAPSALNPKLKSRLEAGLAVTLKTPDLEIRVKYVHHVCKTKKIKLSKEQVLTLAQRCQDFRHLQGLLLKLEAFKKIMHKSLLDKDLNQLLESAEEKTTESIDPQDILSVVAEHYQLSLKTLIGKERHHTTALARQVAMYLCRTLLGCSYPELGRLFGGKDHSTAMYAVKKILTLQTDDADMKTLVTKLTNRCRMLRE